MQCPYCRNPNPAHAITCSLCGNPVDNPKSGGQAIKFLLISFITLGLFFLIGFGAYRVSKEYLPNFLKKKGVELPTQNPSNPGNETVVEENGKPEERLPALKAPEPQPAATIPITGDVVQPVLMQKVEPVYPEAARKQRIEGTVILEAVITKEGNVEDVKISKSLHPLLDEASVKAIKQWRYHPATLGGEPVKVYFTVTLRFKLE